MNTNIFDRIAPGSPDHVFGRVLMIIVLAVLAHFLVLAVRFLSDWLIRKSAAQKTPIRFVTHQPKFITLTGLIASALTFAVYFTAIGFILNVFHVNLTTYLATASVIGLAVGFGSQGLVQDVVTGLTLILSDALDVGDVIEAAGKVGRVERVGLRFTQLSNYFNQEVFVPNRVITDISRFPSGGLSAYADVQVPSNADAKTAAELLGRIAKATREQFSAIILSEPELVELKLADPAWKFLRVTFKIWPGQGGLIETTFRQRVVNELKKLDPNYADWMVTITYRAAATPGKADEGI